VLIPERNKADLDEVPAEIKNDLEFIPIGKMDQLLEAALEEKLTPKPAESAATTPAHN
jgi:ATP-dependent Lon protease